jgi:DNA-binding transcriptional regulator WhiA
MRKEKNITWSNNFAYAIGLFVADGSLSKDGRHLDFTSKDLEQVENFLFCIAVKAPIATKSSGTAKFEKVYFDTQFSDVVLFRFLNAIGIKNNKSLTIKDVAIPDKYFADFLRGLLDGDGSISILIHPESKQKQVKMRFASASDSFLEWLKSKNSNLARATSEHTTRSTRCRQLTYGKEDSFTLIKYMYYSPEVICLKRKFDIAQCVLDLQN